MFMYYLCMTAVVVGTAIFVALKHLILRIPKRMQLNGKHVMITGGSKGIGKALAIKCANRGANVTIIARDVKSLEDCHKELTEVCDFEAVERGRGQWAKWISLDLTKDYNQIETKIREHIQENGSVDILINNAGTSTQAAFLTLPIEQFQKQMSTNYLSAVYMTRAVLPCMQERAQFDAEGESQAPCRIVFMSSQAGQIGLYGYCAYAPSKFALRGLAESLQMELAPFDIHTTVVYPPNTDTEGLKEELKDMPEETKQISSTAGIFAPEYVADIILDDTLLGLHSSTIGLDGWMLGLLTSGAATETTVKNVFQQTLLLPLFRFIILCYQAQFRYIVKKCHANRKKRE